MFATLKNFAATAEFSRFAQQSGPFGAIEKDMDTV
jgi:hypothetical protein